MDVMRQAEFAAVGEHDKKRYKKHSEPEGPDLFAAFGMEFEIRGPYLRKRELHLKACRGMALEFLQSSKKAV